MICFGMIAGIGFQLWRERIPSTDQAMVERDTHPVRTRIDGTIAKIFVSNRQMVKAGDLLVEMDRRDLEVKLAAARAEASQAQTTMRAAAARLAKAQPELERAAFTMRHRERELDEVLLDYQAILGVQHKKGVSPVRLWMARRAYETALRSYTEQKAVLADAIDRVQRDQDLSDATAAKLHAAELTIQQTDRRLSDARIYADVAGRVAFDKSKVARYLRAGEVFLSLVGEPRVVARFNRSQLKRLKPGQRAGIRIRALNDRTLQGKVVSIAPLVGQGSAHRTPASRLAAMLFNQLETAPVKIAFDSNSMADVEDRLNPGLASAVEVAVD